MSHKKDEWFSHIFFFSFFIVSLTQQQRNGTANDKLDDVKKDPIDPTVQLYLPINRSFDDCILK